MSTKAKFWLVGLLLCAAGAIMVRSVAQQYESQWVIQLIITLVGVTLALAGLGMIMAGIRKK